MINTSSAQPLCLLLFLEFGSSFPIDTHPLRYRWCSSFPLQPFETHWLRKDLHFWWQAIDYARLNHSTITFFNFSKPETAASRWSRVRLNASKIIEEREKKEGFESKGRLVQRHQISIWNGALPPTVRLVWRRQRSTARSGRVSFLRLEEKLTNIESENKVLRQQAVSMAPNKILSGRSRSILQRGGESGHLFVDTKTT